MAVSFLSQTAATLLIGSDRLDTAEQRNSRTPKARPASEKDKFLAAHLVHGGAALCSTRCLPCEADKGLSPDDIQEVHLASG